MRFERLASLALVLVLGSCTFGRTDVEPCTKTSDCREAFGIASVCLESGYCEVKEDESRCRPTFPGDWEANPGDYPDITFIGTIIDDSNSVHRARARAIELALEDINGVEGAEGKTFGLVTCNNDERRSLDSLNRDQASVQTATWLRDVVGVAFLVGPQASGATEAVYDQVEDLLIISPSASSDELAALDGATHSDENPGRLWRTALPDGEQAPRITADIRARSVGRLAILHAADTYGNGLARLVTEDLGTDVDIESFSYGEGGYGTLVTLIAQGGSAGTPFDEVLFISSKTLDTYTFLNIVADDAGYETTTFFFTDSAANREFVEGVTSPELFFDRVRGTRPVLPADNTAYSIFAANYEMATASRPDDGLSYTPHAYDAAMIGLYGLAWAYQQEPDTSWRSIARGLRQLNGGAEALQVIISNSGGWDTVRGEFLSGSPVDVVGASGPLDFDPVTEELSGEFEVWKVVAGEIVPAPPIVEPTP